METSKSRRKAKASAGFALIETMIAIFILGVGLLGAAALLAQLAGNSTRSRYMSTEALLASEKLDDLNRLPSIDPAIAVTAGNSAGSLNADLTASVTVGAVTETVDYFDTVQISSGNGSMVETVSGKDPLGNNTFTSTTHAPDGTVTNVISTTPPPGTGDMLSFKRRWIIEQNVPGLPVESRRITVLVSLENGTTRDQFQSSMVR
jgi:prepilin-type N-terminal cleavage/methylation domain-containing protein